MLMRMNILLITIPTTSRSKQSLFSFTPLTNSLSSSSSFRVSCSSQKPQQNGDAKDDSNSNNNGDNNNLSVDWNKAWASFKKRASGGKKRKTQFINPNKYVTWNPRPTNYPLSEEVDSIKRTEKSNLMLWTSPKFTLFGAIVVVSLLLLYTLLAPIK